MFVAVKDQVKREIQRHFDFSVDNRVFLLADIEGYRWKEDESVWNQKKGINPHYFSIYWDSVFVCGFDERTPVEFFMLDFWKNFKRLYKEQKIFFNQKPDIVDEVVEREKEKKKEIDKLPAHNPTQKMAKEVVKRLHAKRKKVKTRSVAK